jgi:hypothetical protein
MPLPRVTGPARSRPKAGAALPPIGAPPDGSVASLRALGRREPHSDGDRVLFRPSETMGMPIAETRVATTGVLSGAAV